MQDWWQHIPLTLHPIAFTVGFFSIYWYALFFLTGFLAALGFVLLLVRKNQDGMTAEVMVDLALWLFFGALLGGRLGYAFFYAPDLFLAQPLQFFSPYDFTHGQWTGIAGMSYHGGLIGVVAVLFWFTKKRELSFWQVADLWVLAAPIGLFFGRLGNFFNLELYGRLTGRPWGMFFPGAEPIGFLRHPSSLYEAALEGCVLFCLLWTARARVRVPGILTSLFVISYAVIRFFLEYVREPDSGVGLFYSLTRGQVLSLVMLFVGAGLFFWLHRKNYAKIG